MTIIVTGAAGFIGSSLCHWLIDNTEHTVIGIDNLSSGYADNLPFDARFRFLKMDVVNAENVNKVFESYKPDVCYCLHAYASEGRSNYIRSFIHLNNTVSVANIINACVNYKCKLIFTSSVAVYSGQPPFTESTMPNPIDEYGLSKWTSERSIQIAADTQGLKWCIVRPRNVYGERQSLFDTARNLMGIWCYQALNKLPLTIYGKGYQTRTFTYIGDIVPCLYKAIEVESKVINLGSKFSYRIEEACKIFKSVTGYEDVVHLEERHEIQAAYCVITLSEELLGFEDKTTLREGLTKMWAWGKEQPMRDLQTPPALEVTKHTHSSIK